MTERKQYQKQYKEQYRQTHKSVNVTLTAEQYQRVLRAAKKHNSKPTTMLRELAFAQLNNTALYPSALLDLLNEHNRLVRSIANNLNQLAHSANVFNEVDQKLVFEHLRQLHNQVDTFTKQSFDTGDDNSTTPEQNSKP